MKNTSQIRHGTCVKKVRGFNMNKNGTKEMTSGSPWKLILSFSIPLLFGMLFQQFYSMVDSIIVGKYLGVDQLAAVGSTSSINFMIIGFCMGVCNGFAIPVAQRFGAGDYKGLRKFTANSVWLSILLSSIMTVIVCILCRDILHWMNTPKDIIEDAYAYIFVLFLGIPATYLYNLCSGIIRSLGDSKTPLVFLLLSSVLNIVLDLVFVIVIKMGVAGAAWATVVSQFISGVLCLFYMKKKYEILKFQKGEAKPDGNCIKTLCFMGIPMGLQYSVTAIGSVILQTAVNDLGSAYVASVAAGSKLFIFLACPLDALGSTIATYAGQNVGAGKIERIGQGVKVSVILGSMYAVIAFLISMLFGEYLSLLFVKKHETVILAQTIQYIRMQALFFIPLCLVIVLRFCIQGLGYSMLAILAGVFEMIARTIIGVFIVAKLGYIAVCIANPTAWIFADCFLVPAFFYVIWRLKKEKMQQEA